MDIKKVIDSFLASDVSASEDEDAKKRLVCELFVEELKRTSVDDLLPHFRSMDLKKAERQVSVHLSFPWDITFSNFLCNK